MSWLISCEHASCEAPPGYGTLGLDARVLRSHVGWDPGAAELAQALACRLQAPCVLGQWTRLLVDLNRSADNAAAVPEVAFGVEVPANRSLPGPARDKRLQRFHAPYWNAIRTRLQHQRATHVSIHSFTPELDPTRRTFPIGLLFDPASAQEASLVDRLACVLVSRGYEVRCNEPYPGTMDLITTSMRNSLPGYVGIELEVNQLIMTGNWQQPLLEALGDGLLSA